MDHETDTERDAGDDVLADDGEPRVRSPRRTTALVAVVALAVGGVVGGAIGWYVERERLTDEIERSRESSAGRVSGEVALFSPGGLVTLRDIAGRSVGVVITDATVVQKTVRATLADVEPGMRLLRPPERRDRDEIIVLPDDTSFSGVRVVAVNEDAVTIETSSGAQQSINVFPTTQVLRIVPGEPSDIVEGSTVVVRRTSANRTAQPADELVVLPAGTDATTSTSATRATTTAAGDS
jgi:hypothetical protein